MEIRAYDAADEQGVVDLALRAWAPVFASMIGELPPAEAALVFPDWRPAQADAVRTNLRTHPATVALLDGAIAGFAVLVVDDRVGAVDMIATDPAVQRRGVARALLEHAVDTFRADGLGLVKIGTGGDPGHAPARAAYESMGFSPLPVVVYYRAL